MEKGKLTVLCGPSGSGKTTYANATNAICISSDDLRSELYGKPEYQYSNRFLKGNGFDSYTISNMSTAEKKKECNRLLFKIMNERAEKLLSEGKDVIYDATSLTAASRKKIIDRFSECSKEISAVYFIIDKETCKLRNSKRDRVVPEFIIDRQFENYEVPKVKEGFKTVIGIPN